MTRAITDGLLVGLLFAASAPATQSMTRPAKLPRIAIAGLAIESSTFSPARTGEAEFRARMGDAVLESYPFLAPGSAARRRATWVPTLTGRALPGGMVTREAYESLLGKMLTTLGAGVPYDGVFFDIHGAMSVEGLDDPEGDMIERIRRVVGKKTVISTSMDLHGNVSERLAHQSDLISCYRMAPHEDEVESGSRRAPASSPAGACTRRLHPRRSGRASSTPPSGSATRGRTSRETARPWW
jgi:hypothetical protein